MSEKTKLQEYTYSFKSAAFTSIGVVNLCTDKILFYLVPPQEALSIQYLRTHLKFQFESSVTPGDRVIEKIGIISAYEYYESGVNHFRSIDINQAADGSRNVELNINLTPLLQKDDVSYSIELTPPGDDYTMIWVKFPNSLATNLSVGRILLWKADALFTTTGIR